MKAFTVDMRINGTTPDGWQSSREVRKITVASDTPGHAFTDVSHLVWDMSLTMFDRYSIGLVTELDKAGQPTRKQTWVRMDYRAGGVAWLYASTYTGIMDQVKQREQREADKGQGNV